MVSPESCYQCQQDRPSWFGALPSYVFVFILPFFVFTSCVSLLTFCPMNCPGIFIKFFFICFSYIFICFRYSSVSCVWHDNDAQLSKERSRSVMGGVQGNAEGGLAVVQGNRG